MGLLDKAENNTFELSLVIRDKDGNPMGRKSYGSDKMEYVADFWHKNKLIRKRKKHRDLGALSPGQAEKLMKEIFGDKQDATANADVEEAEGTE